MKCRNCKREIPENSIYCNWCGKNQLRRKSRKTEPKIAKPTRLASGEYSGQVMKDGRRVRIKTETLEEYNATVAALKAGVITAKYHSDSISLRNAMLEYIDNRRSILSPSTINGYESMAKTRFLHYANRSLGSIDYQKMLNEELASGVSARTVKNAWGFVKAVLKDRDITPPSLSLPQVVQPDLPWLDFEQIIIFLDAIRDKPGELAALLALHSLRRSEFLALTLDNFDLDNEHPERNMIHVRGSLVRGSGNVVVLKETNKTQTSRRDIPIMIPRLTGLLTRLTGTGFVINTNTNTIHGQINSVCKKAGLPLVGVHGLRRSFASLAYHLHWTELQTMRIGGWSDPITVRKIYTKLAQSDIDQGVQDMRWFYGFT
jgi:integrase